MVDYPAAAIAAATVSAAVWFAAAIQTGAEYTGTNIDPFITGGVGVGLLGIMGAFLKRLFSGDVSFKTADERERNYTTLVAGYQKLVEKQMTAETLHHKEHEQIVSKLGDLVSEGQEINRILLGRATGNA